MWLVRAGLTVALCSSPSPPSAAAPPPPADARLTTAGIVVSSSAAVGLGMLTGGLVVGHRAEKDYVAATTAADQASAHRIGTRANAVAVTGALTAGVLLGIGATLIVLGKRRDVTSAWRFSPGGLQIRF